MSAVFRVKFAGPLVTFQDAGRAGLKRFGVARSGPMDRLSHAAANAAIGNSPGATCIEISLGGLVLECLAGQSSIAIAGGEFSTQLGSETLDGWSVFAMEPGDVLHIRAGPSGSWTYLAAPGGFDAPNWLGHSATHAPSGLGGGTLKAGQELNVLAAEERPGRHGAIERPDSLTDADALRVVLGPQNSRFDPRAERLLLDEAFELTDAFDRMGVRLKGPSLDHAGALSIPSEPVAKGSIQVAGDGVPTVLLADHQTTGGYPKIATVISADLDQLCQMRSRDRIRFAAVSPSTAIEIARERSKRVEQYLLGVAQPKGTLEERLLRENLISGVVAG